MNKKKAIICSISILVVVAIIIFCILYIKVRKVNDFMNLDSVKKVSIFNGTNGEIVDVIDDNQKKDIINSLDNLELSSYNGEKMPGWTFAIILSDGEDEVKLTFKGVKRLSINSGCEYTIKNVDDNLQKLCDSFME